jgi:hypothetical protein
MSRWLRCLLVFVVACGSSDPSKEELREDWQARAPERYVAKVCGTGFGPRLCRVSAVENHQPLETFGEDFDHVWTRVEPMDPIERMLDSLGEHPSCDQRVETHRQYGFPTEVYFDCNEEGFGNEVTCFVPDTLDLRVCQDLQATPQAS